MPGPRHKAVSLVPQSDPARDVAVVDDPSVRATAGLFGKPCHPGLEPGRRIDVVSLKQPETILMNTGAPLGVGF
jgi:hypothetical protein